MASLINIFLRNSIKLKQFIVITILFIVISIIQIYYFENIDSKVKGNIVDFFIYSFGGFHLKDTMISFYAWLIILLPFTIVLNNIFYINTSYEFFILIRSTNRIRWFIAKYTSIIIVSFIYLMWILVINTTIGSIGISNEQEWSELSDKIFKYLINLSSNPDIVILMIIVKLFVGVLELSTFLFTFSLLLKNNINHYYITIFVLVVLCFSYKIEMIPVYLSPLNYPSFVNIAIHSAGDWSVIYLSLKYSISSIIVLLFIGYFIIRKRSIVK